MRILCELGAGPFCNSCRAELFEPIVAYVAALSAWASAGVLRGERSGPFRATPGTL